MNYELTLTLLPKYYEMKAEEQFKLVDQWVNKYLHEFHISAVAELTQLENIHVHAVIELDSVGKTKFCNVIRHCGKKLFGRKSLTQIKNYNNWIMYMRKDLFKADKPWNPLIIDKQQVLLQKYLFKLNPSNNELYIDSLEVPLPNAKCTSSVNSKVYSGDLISACSDKIPPDKANKSNNIKTLKDMATELNIILK